MAVKFPQELTEQKKLTLDAARSIVGRWLAFTRQLPHGDRQWALDHRPPMVEKAYKLSNLKRDIPEATRKRMGMAGNAVPHVSRSVPFRLHDMIANPLPDGAKIVLRQVRPRGRSPFTTAYLEIPHPDFHNYVTRFKASYSQAYMAVACTTTGRSQRPANAPKTFAWRKISPKDIHSLHPTAQLFIKRLQSTKAERSPIQS